MSIFGKKDKNIKTTDRRYIVKLLTEFSVEIIKKGAYTRFGVGFIKLTAEYDARVARSELDNDRYLVNTLESLVKMRQEEDANDTQKSSKENIISIYETLPDLIKIIKAQLNEAEMKLEKLEVEKEKMMIPLDGILEEMDKLKKAEK